MISLDSILTLLGGIGALLLGFKILSENIEKISSSGLKRLFNKTSNNRFIGVGIGALVTAIIQSSGATTIMIVGFVNAGIMNLFQATAMIMGANIGTTITAHIASLQSLPIALIAGVLALIGMFMEMLSKNDKVKTWGLILAGLGIVFIALKLMSGSMEEIKSAPEVINLLRSISNPLLLFVIGALITALVQSSSAITSIIISMYAVGMTIGTQDNSVLYLILGTNVGTCITALLSSIGASVNARRAASIHLMFNTFGSVLFFIVLLLWPNFYSVVLRRFFTEPATQIAMFHTLFNVICTLTFVGIINLFVKISEVLIPNKKEDVKTTYLDERLINTPSLAISQAVKETVRLGSISMETLDNSITMFLSRKLDMEEKIREKISDIEIVNREIVSFLVKTSAGELTVRDENTISSLHHMLNDFIREAEIADNMIKYTHSVERDSIEFSESAMSSIKEIQGLLKKQFKNVERIILDSEYELIHDVKNLEETIDNMRNNLIDGHIKRLEEGKCKPQSSGVFINLISNLERAGDHLDYIADIAMNNAK